MSTTEKILAEALELHEKGVSLHSIVRTYPDHKEDIEQLFGAMATLSLEKEKIRVPASGLERLLAALPEQEPAIPTKTKISIPTPFTSFVASIRFSSFKYVLPIAALALITGGFALRNGVVAPTAPAPFATPQETTSTEVGDQVALTTPTDTARSTQSTSAPTAAMPMAMSMKMVNENATPAERLVASFSEEAANEAMIAQQNDTDTETALAADKAITTDPTPNEN